MLQVTNNHKIYSNVLTISSEFIHRLLGVPRVLDILICEPHSLQQVLQLRDGTERVLHLGKVLVDLSNGLLVRNNQVFLRKIAILPVNPQSSESKEEKGSGMLLATRN